MSLIKTQPQAVLPAPPTVVLPYIPAQHKLLTIEVALVSTAAFVGLARVYVRSYLLKSFKTDDWLMLGALLLDCLSAVSFSKAVYYGLGQRIENIPGPFFIPQLQWTFAYFVLSSATLTIVKLSIGFNLLRLAPDRPYRRVLVILLWALSIAGLVGTMVIVFQCIPTAAYWDYSLRPPPSGIGTAKCIPGDILNAINIAMSTFVLMTDVILALLPAPIIWNLQISTRIKLSLSIVLGLSIIACIGGTIKLYHQGFLNNFIVAYRHMLEWYKWQFVEVNVAIIAASLPTIQPLLRFVLKLVNFTPKRRQARQKNSSGKFVQLKEVGSDKGTTSLTITVTKTVEQYRSSTAQSGLRRGLAV